MSADAQWNWMAFPYCCDDEPPPDPCLCECTCCEDECAPCCWAVRISNMPVGDCSMLDGIHYLTQDQSDNCHWSTFAEAVNPCGPGSWEQEINLYVTCAGGVYVIQVEAGGHTWELSYGSDPPNCDGILDWEELDWVATAGDCDSSGATCEIMPADGNENCEPPDFCCTNGVMHEDAPVSDTVSVTLSGFSNLTCSNCTDIDGTYILQRTGSAWYYCADWECDSGATTITRIVFYLTPESQPGCEASVTLEGAGFVSTTWRKTMDGDWTECLDQALVPMTNPDANPVTGCLGGTVSDVQWVT